MKKKNPKSFKKTQASKLSPAFSRGKIVPLGDRVLVKPILSNEKMTPGGIIIPDTIDKERPERGKVVAVGEGKWVEGTLIPLSIKVGDTIVFSKYGFDELKIDGEEYFVIKEENILVIINT